MSFLLTDEDDAAALAEALAFIDACDTASSSSGEGVGIDGFPRATGVAVGGPNGQNDATRRERNRIHGVHRRQRRKGEKRELQLELEGLERQLARLQPTPSLQRRSEGAVCGDSTDGSESSGASWTPSHSLLTKKRKNISTLQYEGSWETMAAIRRQARLEAELLNIKLKKALALELKVSRSLSALLEKRPPLQVDGIDDATVSRFISKKQPVITRCSPSALQHDPTAVLQELKEAMEQLYTDVRSMAPPTPALSYNYNVSFDPVHGPVSELTSTTPLYWDLNRTKQFLGPNFLKEKMSGSLKLKEVRTTDGGRIENQFTVEIGKPGTSTMLDRMGSMSRYEEEDRVLVTWFALTFHRKGALCFRERGWIVAARSPSNPTTESVVQTHYTLEAEKAADCTVVDGEDVDRVRDRVIGALADIMKTKHKRIQQAMLAETGRPDLVSLVSY